MANSYFKTSFFPEPWRENLPIPTIPTDNPMVRGSFNVQNIEVTIKFSFDNVTASSLNHSAIRRMNGASRSLIWHLKLAHVSLHENSMNGTNWVRNITKNEVWLLIFQASLSQLFFWRKFETWFPAFGSRAMMQLRYISESPAKRGFFGLIW